MYYDLIRASDCGHCEDAANAKYLIVDAGLGELGGIFPFIPWLDDVLRIFWDGQVQAVHTWLVTFPVKSVRTCTRSLVFVNGPVEVGQVKPRELSRHRVCILVVARHSLSIDIRSERVVVRRQGTLTRSSRRELGRSVDVSSHKRR